MSEKLNFKYLFVLSSPGRNILEVQITNNLDPNSPPHHLYHWLNVTTTGEDALVNVEKYEFVSMDTETLGERIIHKRVFNSSRVLLEWEGEKGKVEESDVEPKIVELNVDDVDSVVPSTNVKVGEFLEKVVWGIMHS